MRTGIVIRSETDADVGTIADFTIAAFSTLPIRLGLGSGHVKFLIIHY